MNDMKPWRLIIYYSCMLMMLSSIPYFYGLWRTPLGSIYTGLHALTPGDFHVYFTQMRLAGEGIMSVMNPYAGVDGIGSMSMVNPFWYALGKIAAVTTLPPSFVFHAVRILMIPLLVLVVYRLVMLLLPHRHRLHRVAIALVLFSSGIGYFVYPFLPTEAEQPHIYAWPLDLWVPESNTFLTLYHSPHLLASLILFLFILAAFLSSLSSSRSFVWHVSAGLAAAALGLFHPFHLITLAVIIPVWTALLGRHTLRRALAGMMIIICVAIPSIAWHVSRMSYDWVTMQWARGNINLTPPLWTLVAGYGALLPFALAGFFYLRRSRESVGTDGIAELMRRTAPWLLISWWAVHLILIYSPFIFQRRLIEGMHVPLALLAGAGCTACLSYIDARWRIPVFVRTAVVVSAVLFLASSTLGTVSRDLVLFKQQEPAFYLTPELQTVFQGLASQKERDGVVLAGYVSSNFIPAWTGRMVYGTPGGAHSPLFEEVRRPMIEWFIAGKGSISQRRRFLQRERITAVVVAPLDGLDASALSSDDLLALQYAHDGTFLYFVR